MKEKISKVIFNVTPQVRVRVIEFEDADEKKKEKRRFPFKLDNDVIVTVCIDGGCWYNELSNIQTEPREFGEIVEKQDTRFSFKISQNYIWNGADIPRFFWRFVGSKTDNAFLTASMVHDFMLENKEFLMKEVLQNKLSTKAYRRLTSLIFRQILKQTGIKTIKANVMSWCVQVYQSTFNAKEWRNPPKHKLKGVSLRV